MKKSLSAPLNRKGFTLLELLIVVAIIGILVGIAVPAVSTAMEKSRETADLANIRSKYAEFAMTVMTEGTASDVTVELQQTKAGWEVSSAQNTLNMLTENHVVGAPKDGSNKATIKWLQDEKCVQIVFEGEGDSGGGSDDSGGGSSGGGTTLHTTDIEKFDRGALLQDATGACVVSTYNWALRTDFYTNNMTVSEIEQKYPENVIQVNPSNVKEATSLDVLQPQDICRVPSTGQYYYVTVINKNEEIPNGEWIPLVQ